jgi:ElaB/YqjD/DUF883 family membrane-anchored ribosome-binding protein
MTDTNSRARPSATLSDLGDRAARKADQALDATHRLAQDTIDSLQEGLDGNPDDLAARLERAASQLEAATRRGLAQARETSAELRERAARAGERGVDYIRDELRRSVLVAAATGAALALLVRALSQRPQRG